MKRANISLSKLYLSLFFMIFTLQSLFSITYKEAKDLYDNKDYSAALSAFLAFADEFPESNELDNALYYAGRIELKNKNTETAEKYFNAVIVGGKGSHYSLSLLNLSRIYNSRKDYEKVISLLSSIEDIKAVKKNNLLLASELSEAHYQLGRLSLSHDKNSIALENFLGAEDLSLHLNTHSSPDDRLDILIRLARINKHLFSIYRASGDTLTAEKYRNSGLEMINTAEQEDTENKKEKTVLLIRKAFADSSVSKEKTPYKFEGEFFAGGGSAVLADIYGAEFEGEIKATADLKGKNLLIFTGGYLFDSFSKKTFNFPDITREDIDRRLYQYTNNINADLAWRYGSLSSFYSKLVLGTSFLTAEEKEDNSMSFDISETLYYRVSDLMRPGLKLKAVYTKFPNYLSSGRKLDSLSFQTAPSLRFFISDMLYFNIEYSYKLKQYLDANYDTADIAVSDSDNRMYHIHSAELALKAELSKNWQSKLSYSSEYLTAENYDLWVSFENPVSQVFVENYFENIEHKIIWKNDFIYGESVSLDIDSFISYQKYLNYPARSSIGEDKDELRSDFNFGIKLSTELELDESWSMRLNTVWETNISNTDYDSSYSTNYDWLTAVVGIAYNF